MVLQHASTSDDYLLARDLCVVPISKVEKRATRSGRLANYSDKLRQELGVSTLAEVKKRAKKMENEFYEGRKKKAD